MPSKGDHGAPWGQHFPGLEGQQSGARPSVHGNVGTWEGPGKAETPTRSPARVLALSHPARKIPQADARHRGFRTSVVPPSWPTGFSQQGWEVYGLESPQGRHRPGGFHGVPAHLSGSEGAGGMSRMCPEGASFSVSRARGCQCWPLNHTQKRAAPAREPPPQHGSPGPSAGDGCPLQVEAGH